MEEKIVNTVNKIGMGEVIPLDRVTLDVFLVDFVEVPSRKILKYIESNSDFTTFTGLVDTGQEEKEERVLILRLTNSYENSFFPPDNRWIGEWEERNKDSILEHFFVRSPNDRNKNP